MFECSFWCWNAESGRVTFLYTIESKKKILLPYRQELVLFHRRPVVIALKVGVCKPEETRIEDRFLSPVLCCDQHGRTRVRTRSDVLKLIVLNIFA